MKRRSFISLVLAGIGYIVLGNVLCLVMTLAFAVFGSNLMMDILLMVCCTLIFYLLVFTVAWKDGTRERSLVKLGRVENRLRFRWVRIGLCMFAFAALPTVILLLNKLFFPSADTLPFYRVISGSAYPFFMTYNACAVQNTAEQAQNSPDLPTLFPALMLLYYAVIPAVTQLGYYMGYNDKLNTDKIMYK